jgi:hypothetical protein
LIPDVFYENPVLVGIPERLLPIGVGQELFPGGRPLAGIIKCREPGQLVVTGSNVGNPKAHVLDPVPLEILDRVLGKPVMQLGKFPGIALIVPEFVDHHAPFRGRHAGEYADPERDHE